MKYFNIINVNDMYINELKTHGINKKRNTTHFTELLVKSIPTLYSEVVGQRTQCLFDYKVKELITDYVKSPDDFFLSLRNVVTPIRKEMSKQCNEFDGQFSSSCQVNSVPRLLLCLISNLIDGNSGNGNNGFSQEVLTVAQMIMSHQRKSNK